MIPPGLISKEELTEKIRQVAQLGWVDSRRPGNDGSVGNTLEDLLGIPENNLPIPNAAEWELKAQRTDTSSLITLMHMEPSPRAARIVPSLLLPNYGWPHKEAGRKYPQSEKSFRQTITAGKFTPTGFTIKVNRHDRRVETHFDASRVHKGREDWLAGVKESVGLGPLNPMPYWGFDDLHHKAGVKLLNTFMVEANRRRIDGREQFHYRTLHILQRFALDQFMTAIETGKILIDYDASTGHNHGTKFRVRQDAIKGLYEECTTIALSDSS
ncbi:MAG: hypothetical protein BMS9Abin05_2146 [Rhodothermia bacterium]|nr:MAG: hypothetical protein BMS9Abin05_2146 [Rhodothermia bacterium]